MFRTDFSPMQLRFRCRLPRFDEMLCSGLVGLVVLLSASPAIAQSGLPPKPASPGPESQSKKKAAAAPRLPLAEDTDYSYRWILDGSQVGETVFRFSITEKGLQLRSSWTYSARGRQHSSECLTLLDSKTLEPLGFEQDFRNFVSQRLGSPEHLESQVDAGIMKIRRVAGGRVFLNDLVTLPGNVLFGNQAFEHMVVLAAVVHERGAGTYNLVQPKAVKVLEASIQLDGEEKERGIQLRRYRLKATGFEAKLWIREDGLLQRFQQNELEVVRGVARPATAPRSTPKSPPASQPKD